MLPWIPPAFALAFIAACIVARWPLWASAFQSDFSPVAWLSSAQLLAGALLALRLGVEGSLPRRLSLWLGAALAGLALDEQFMFHEQWKYGCSGWIAACASAWVRELPMLAIGVLGLITLAWMHRAIPSLRARGFAWAAVTIGVFALLVDQLPMPEPIASFEEGFEVLAEALFLAALLAVPPSTERATARTPQVHSP